MTMKKTLPIVVVLIVALILINYGSGKIYKRVDLTKDGRYTLSPEAIALIKNVNGAISIDVFLDGDLPGEFRKLRQETKQLLEEMVALNPNIKFDFINPLEGYGADESDQVIKNLMDYGIKPALATLQQAGKNVNVTVFPYAIILYNDKTIPVPLLKTVARSTAVERVNSSIQQLEFQFADGLRKATTEKTKTIAVMRDSGQLGDKELADFITSLQQYYRVAPFGIEYVTTTDSVLPSHVLSELKEYDLVIEAKPTKPLSETKKYILDQYIMNGGKLLLAADPIIMENDSLANPEGKAYALARDLNIDIMLFKYGLRLNNGLVKDLRSGPLALATGQGRNTQYEAFDWPYYPISKSVSNNPITKNVEDVKFEYAGTIDTLKNNIKKTILLSTSKESQTKVLPAIVNLSELENEIDPLAYQTGEQPLAVLAEGSFSSAYKNLVKPFNLINHKDSGLPSAILLIADGDVMKNQIDRGKPQELGYDMRTGSLFGNKEFLMNAVNYMLDDAGLIKLRNKNIVVPFLNPQKAYDEKTKWQFINIVLPLALVALFGLYFNYRRKKKYTLQKNL